MKTLIFFLLLSVPLFAADPVTYDPATGEVKMTLNPTERAILKRAAKHVKMTEPELIKQTNENWIKNVAEALTKVREQNLRERYEKLTPAEKKTVEDVMGPIP